MSSVCSFCELCLVRNPQEYGKSLTRRNQRRPSMERAYRRRGVSQTVWSAGCRAPSPPIAGRSRANRKSFRVRSPEVPSSEMWGTPRVRQVVPANAVAFFRYFARLEVAFLDNVSNKGHISQRIDGSKKLAPTARLLFVLCRVQILAKHSSGPVRNRLRDFTQLAADELSHYAVATAMRGVVVDD